MTMFKPLIRYADFKGRSDRSELLQFLLLALTLAVVPTCVWSMAWGLADGLRGLPPKSPLSLLPIIGLFLLIPALSVGVRRLHDIDHSGWWLLLNLVPGGVAVLIVFALQDGTAGDNRFGSPQGEAAGAMTAA
jgi:uncharacterized membrane protein YhaH (DUF805 family)